MSLHCDQHSQEEARRGRCGRALEAMIVHLPNHEAMISCLVRQLKCAPELEQRTLVGAVGHLRHRPLVILAPLRVIYAGSFAPTRQGRSGDASVAARPEPFPVTTKSCSTPRQKSAIGSSGRFSMASRHQCWARRGSVTSCPQDGARNAISPPKLLQPPRRQRSAL